jgi:hypothetical protein
MSDPEGAPASPLKRIGIVLPALAGALTACLVMFMGTSPAGNFEASVRAACAFVATAGLIAATDALILVAGEPFLILRIPALAGVSCGILFGGLLVSFGSAMGAIEGRSGTWDANLLAWIKTSAVIGGALFAALTPVALVVRAARQALKKKS